MPLFLYIKQLNPSDSESSDSEDGNDVKDLPKDPSFSIKVEGPTNGNYS